MCVVYLKYLHVYMCRIVINSTVGVLKYAPCPLRIFFTCVWRKLFSDPHRPKELWQGVPQSTEEEFRQWVLVEGHVVQWVSCR